MISCRSTTSALCVLCLCGLLRSAQASPCEPICTLEPACAKLVEEGKSLYKQALYQEALTKYLSAYVKSRDPALLLNIGAALYRLNRPAEALSYYEEYQQKCPDLKQFTVYKYIQAAQKLLAPPAPASIPHPQAPPKPLTVEALAPETPSPQPQLPPVQIDKAPSATSPLPLVPNELELSAPPVSEPRESQGRATPWFGWGGAVSVAGIIGLIVGAGCYGAAQGAQEDFSRNVDEYEKRSFRDHADTLGTCSIASYTVGLVGVATGAVLIGLGGRQLLREKAARRKLAWSTQSQVLGLGMQGTY